MSEIDALLKEERTFPPSKEWKSSAVVTDPAVYGRAEQDPEGFWASFAGEREWTRPWD
jgi:acetyl-CoA synthetase